MADSYDSLLQRLIGSLEPNTEGTRQQLYSQAREILINRLKTQQPPLDAKSVRAEQSKLDEAIDRVESHYAEPVFNTKGTFGSLSPVVKAAIALPSALLIILLSVGAYFYLGGAFNPRATTVQLRPAPEQKTLDRTEALRILAGSSAVTKSLPLSNLWSPSLWGSHTLVPTVEMINEMIREPDDAYNRRLEGFKRDGLQSGIGPAEFYNAMLILRAYWRTGFFESFAQTTFGSQLKWTASLKNEWKQSCQQQSSASEFQDCLAIVSIRSVASVTGVAGDNRSALVEYIVTQKNTEFGRRLFPVFKALNPYEDLHELNETVETYVAQFLRYDDGWRFVKAEKK